jgi:hypothetical protein
MTRYGSMDHMSSLQHHHHHHPQQQQPSQQQQPQRRLMTTQQRKLSQQQQPQNVVQPFVATSDEMSQQQQTPPNAEKLDIIPMNMDKPSGLPVNDFLPRKFQNLNLNSQPTNGGGNSGNDNSSKFSAYKSYCQPATHELSEAEVTSSILKGHDSMMAVLANRGRHLEIIHKLWQSKDAKTGKNLMISEFQFQFPIKYFKIFFSDSKCC